MSTTTPALTADVDFPVVVGNAIEEFRAAQVGAYETLVIVARSVEASRGDEVGQARADQEFATEAAQALDEAGADSAAAWLMVDDLTTAWNQAEAAYAQGLAALEAVEALDPR